MKLTLEFNANKTDTIPLNKYQITGLSNLTMAMEKKINSTLYNKSVNNLMNVL